MAIHGLLVAALLGIVSRAAPEVPEGVTAVPLLFEAPAAPAASGPAQPTPGEAEPATPPAPAESAPAPAPAESAPPPAPAEPAPPPAPAEPVPPPPEPQQPRAEPAPSAPPPAAPAAVPRPLAPEPPVARRAAAAPRRQAVARPKQAAPAPSPGAAAEAHAPAAPAGSVAQVAPVAPAQGPAVTPGWDGMLAAWLAAHKSYPALARERGETGTVTVRFTVGRDGAVLDAALVSGSGSAVIDAAALSLLQHARLPPPMAELTRTIRLRYRLED